ncbi:MAG: TIGR00296 family protein [Candidatus Nanoarchaeia archaeon]
MVIPFEGTNKMFRYSDEEGALAVRIAREIISDYVKEGKVYQHKNRHKIPQKFNEKAGVFVTLESYPELELRGCIGYPEPIFPLIEALKNAAIGAAADDPRFFPVDPKELKHIVVEVSLLTPPKLIRVKNPNEYLEKIKIGRDGLIVEKDYCKGLLLPQVPVEWNWDIKEFLAHTCRKAGLSPEEWKDKDTKIYAFTAEIFHEIEPHGEIKRKILKPNL